MTAPQELNVERVNPYGGFSSLTSQVDASALSTEEQRAISWRLGANMFGAGLLAVGVLMERSAGGDVEVAQLIQAGAAAIVAIGIFWQALSGFLARPPRNFTEQLVALGVLAAMAAGDFVSATLVPLFLEIGHLFEERSALGAHAAIERLRALCSRRATVLIDETERTVPSERIQVGARLIVRPGEVIAADGVVRSGFANIDQSPVTGESNPKSVRPGDSVYAGTINQDGLLHVEVQSAGEGTVLGEVVRVLREVENSKTPIVRMLEKAAAFYLPAVVLLAAGVLFTTGELGRFIAVLIVACPCALVLAAPAAMVAAMSTATKESILIKNAAFLEAVASVDTLVLDKTGTLTEGAQAVDDVWTVSDLSQDEVVQLAAAAAHGSRHPAAKAICDEAARRALHIAAVDVCREAPGRGVEATLHDEIIRIGRASWLRECGATGDFDRERSGVWVCKGTDIIGFVGLFDRARTDAHKTIERMRGLGFDRIVLLTGDRIEVATRVATELDLDDVFAEVLPAGKLAVIRSEQAAGRRVLMVGDGINDALALSAAEVGVAIGAEMNEVALGGADVALLSNDLSRLPQVVRLADRTRQIIVENVVIGIVFSFGMLGLATLGFISPIAGALFHNAGAIFVVFNSSRLLEKEKTTGAAPSTEMSPSDDALPTTRESTKRIGPVEPSPDDGNVHATPQRCT